MFVGTSMAVKTAPYAPTPSIKMSSNQPANNIIEWTQKVRSTWQEQGDEKLVEPYKAGELLGGILPTNGGDVAVE